MKLEVMQSKVNKYIWASSTWIHHIRSVRMKGGREGRGWGGKRGCTVSHIGNSWAHRTTVNWKCMNLDAQGFKNLTSKIESVFLAGAVESDLRGVNTWPRSSAYLYVRGVVAWMPGNLPTGRRVLSRLHSSTLWRVVIANKMKQP